MCLHVFVRGNQWIELKNMLSIGPIIFKKIYAQTRNIVASDIKERALDSLLLWGAVSSSIKTETKTKIFTEQLFGHMPET